MSAFNVSTSASIEKLITDCTSAMNAVHRASIGIQGTHRLPFANSTDALYRLRSFLISILEEDVASLDEVNITLSDLLSYLINTKFEIFNSIRNTETFRRVQSEYNIVIHYLRELIDILS
jgi:hypothetical protein